MQLNCSNRELTRGEKEISQRVVQSFEYITLSSIKLKAYFEVEKERHNWVREINYRKHDAWFKISVCCLRLKSQI
jgi:hypothetical protein